MSGNVISIHMDFKDIITKLENVAPKQVEFAVMTTLNKAAYEASQAIRKEVGRVFDRPTAWVLGGVRYTKATRSRLLAKVHLDSWGNKQGVTVEKVLAAQIDGGARRPKRFESALSRAGVLPRGMVVIPGAAAARDAYGNMSAGQIVQILSWFKAFGEQGYSANMRDGGKRLGRDNRRTGARGFAYFALKARRGKLAPGIYKRYQIGFGSAVKPIMIFAQKAAYRRRLDFTGVGLRAANEVIERELMAAIDRAVDTALK